MIAVFAALLPTFVLILLGHGMRRLQFLADGFWAPAEKLTYYVMLPALLISNLSEARVEGLPVVALAALLAGLTIAASAGMVALRPLLKRVDGPAFSSMLQGTVRPNTYIGLAAAASLWGAEGVTLVAIGIAVVVPLVNLISVAGILRYAAPRRPSPLQIVLPIVRNPLILACLIGVLLNWSGLVLPPGVAPIFKILGGASLPIGLLAVGAGLNLGALRGSGSPVLLSSLFKLALLPLATGLVAAALRLPPTVIGAATLYAALPCAPSAYVLARQMGGDWALSATIITTQTILAFATIPLAILAVGSLP